MLKLILLLALGLPMAGCSSAGRAMAQDPSCRSTPRPIDVSEGRSMAGCTGPNGRIAPCTIGAGGCGVSMDTSALRRLPPDDARLGVGPLRPDGRRGLHVELLTMPLILRPQASGVPPQLNASANGALYIGFRVALPWAGYAGNAGVFRGMGAGPLALSGGVFTGLGSTFISPTSTLGRVQMEYDGMVWNRGLAVIVTADQLILGIALGFGSLLNAHGEEWIYQHEPWIGLTLGLNP